jgi:nucleotidyltransferase/DNA polymerase involved in DNA repair
MSKTSAKQSAVDQLHRLFCAELVLRLQAGDASAAVLNTIGAFLKTSGVKPTQDSPALKRLTAAWAGKLPFKDEPPQLPTTPNHSAGAQKAHDNDE